MRSASSLVRSAVPMSSPMAVSGVRIWCDTSASASATRWRSWSVGTPRFSGPKATSFSMRLATSWSSGFWNTMPAWLRMK